MKKVITMFIIFVSLITIQACQTETPNLVISKVFDATSMSNNAIELYNPTNEAISLDDVEIRIYNNGSTTEGGDHAMTLNGTIEPANYYVISGNNATESLLLENTDFSFDSNLPFNGNDVIELFYNNQKIDQFGLLGYDINFSVDLTMIRLGYKEDYVASLEYDQYNFIAYLPDMFNYLKNDDHDIKTLEQLYQGPQLEQRYLDMPYVDPNNDELGFGGAVIVNNTGLQTGIRHIFKQ